MNENSGEKVTKIKPKEPLMALLLSSIFPGLGQIYAGQMKRGVLCFLLFAGISIFIMLCFFLPATKWNIFLHLLALMLPFLVLSVIVDAYKQANNFNRQNDLSRMISLRKKTMLIIAILCFGFLLNPTAKIFSYIKNEIALLFKIPTDAMEPTIKEGDSILVDRITYKKSNPKRGDVIVFKMPNDISKLHIKRLIGLPGDSIEIKEGSLIINGRKIEESPFPLFNYQNITIKEGSYGMIGQLVKVPEGHYFVLGDYSAHSFDSRQYGFVPKENLVGKAYKIYLPFNRAGRIK